MRSRHIPVRHRRSAMRRAAGHCQVRWSMCAHGTRLEYHHRRTFAEGGTHRSANLVVACRPCHEAIHYAHSGQALQDGLLVRHRNPWKRWVAYWERTE